MTEPAKDEALERMNETLKRLHMSSPKTHHAAKCDGRGKSKVISDRKDNESGSAKKATKA